LNSTIYKNIFIIWSIIILILTSIPGLHTPVDELWNVDKLAHFTVYLIFAFLFILMNINNDFKKTQHTLILLSIIVPIFDELHQIPIPGRQFSLLDIIADFIGFATIIVIFKNKKIRLKIFNFFSRNQENQ
jgi:VanZ family protein